MWAPWLDLGSETPGVRVWILGQCVDGDRGKAQRLLLGMRFRFLARCRSDGRLHELSVAAEFVGGGPRRLSQVGWIFESLNGDEKAFVFEQAGQCGAPFFKFQLFRECGMNLTIYLFLGTRC